jgi:hypothetical protein
MYSQIEVQPSTDYCGTQTLEVLVHLRLVLGVGYCKPRPGSPNPKFQREVLAARKG